MQLCSTASVGEAELMKQQKLVNSYTRLPPSSAQELYCEESRQRLRLAKKTTHFLITLKTEGNW